MHGVKDGSPKDWGEEPAVGISRSIGPLGITKSHYVVVCGISRISSAGLSTPRSSKD